MTTYKRVDNIQIVNTLESVNGTTKVTVVREGFEDDVVKVLEEMWPSQTGGAVLRTIGSSIGDVYIIPKPGNPNDILQSDETGDAKGMRSDVGFEPAAWPEQRNTLNAREVLLHELVHSVRQLSGHLKQVPTHDSYGDMEEFFAIVVGNVYRSELQRIGLRGGHNFESLPPKQRDDAAVFLSTGQYRKRLETLKSENGDLFNAVAAVNAKWNPLKLMTPAGAKH